MRKTIRMEVLMAGAYQIPEGKKVDFIYDRQRNLYLVESSGKVIGLANCVKGRSRAGLKRLGNEYSGCVVKSCPQHRKLTVKIRLKRKEH